MGVKTIFLPIPCHNKSKECASNMCPMRHSGRRAAETKNKVANYYCWDKVFRLNGYGQKNKHEFYIWEHHPECDQYTINSPRGPNRGSIEGIVGLLDYLLWNRI